ncbi:MAG TPA: DUF4159 domain-containing protein [Longimicrobiaceae bacterium]
MFVRGRGFLAAVRAGRGPLLRTALPLMVLAGAVTALAQSPRWGRGAWQPRAVHEGLPEERGGFMFCRLLYTSVRREPGGQGWSTDYPVSDGNFMTRLSQFTETPISRWSPEEPGYVVVRATDPNLFQCPLLFASDVGTMGLEDAEVERLREYLLKGGFFWVDDFWGDRAWRHWVDQIARVLPGYAIEEVPLDHRILSTFYQVDHIPQIPSIQFWRGSGGATSERGDESAEPHLRAIFDESGRILVLMSHNTDIADGWEREGEDLRFLDAFSPDAYALGINIALWAMTH